MNRQTPAHLEYDQLLQAAVDESDLNRGGRDHLESCTVCQREVRRLVQRYDRLGQMARKMAPEPTQAFRVPEQSTTRTRWQFKPAVALGMIGALIFVFTAWWPRHIESPDAPVTVVAQNSADNGPAYDPLMDEIDDLVADALPVAYQEWASVSESQSIEELIDLIVPAIEEEDELEPRA